VGSSIAVNGVCLTIAELRPDSFSADLAPETLKRSNLGDLRPGSRVNLERPLSPSGRMDGHIVQGHVDGTGEFLALDSLGEDNWWLRVRIPDELDAYLVYKGSIAIDGISLTVASIESGVLSATIIPHTFRNTTLGGYRPGARVNLECDILAKHAEKRWINFASRDISRTGLLACPDRPGGLSYISRATALSIHDAGICATTITTAPTGINPVA
jgi:riboflavin synthase